MTNAQTKDGIVFGQDGIVFANEGIVFGQEGIVFSMTSDVNPKSVSSSSRSGLLAFFLSIACID